MPNTPSVRLINGAVVKVGDKVPMTDGGIGLIVAVDGKPGADGEVCVRVASAVGVWWHTLDGVVLGLPNRPAIDLAALQARAPGEREAMRALAATWREEADGLAELGEHHGDVRPIGALACDIKAEIYRECAAALEALARKEG